MKRWLTIIALAALGMVAFIPPPARSSTPVSAAFYATTPGAYANVTFSGQAQCQVNVFPAGLPPTGMNITPQVSTNNAVWKPATTISGGSITAVGSWSGTVDSASNTNFQITIQNLNAPVYGYVVCSDAAPLPVFSGQVASQATPAAGSCIGVSTPPAAGTIAYTCATPGPGSVSGAAYLAALNTLGFTHAWTGASPGPSPAACASSQPVTDAIGAQNLTGINSTGIICNTAPIIYDGTSTSFFICSDQGTNPCGGSSIHDYFSVPSAALPVSTALTECSAFRDSGGPFNNAGGTLFSYDNADRLELYTQGSLYGTADVRSNGSQSSFARMDHARHLICVVSNGTNVITYLDGMPDLLTTNNPSGGPGGAGGWGTQVVSGPTLVCNCYVQWLSVGPAMTNAQMLWLFLKSGI